MILGGGDPARPPRHFMPAGVAALARLGLNGEKGAPFNGVRYHVGERSAEGRFPEARGVRSLGAGFGGEIWTTPYSSSTFWAR